MAAHHSDLTEGQLSRLGAVLRQLNGGQPFSAGQALTAALGAGVINDSSDIGGSLDDLEDAGVVRQVQKNPPRWEAAKPACT
ncbi:MAG: hypothetical protein ACRD0H_12995 [Actinomycetes bacterium]